MHGKRLAAIQNKINFSFRMKNSNLTNFKNLEQSSVCFGSFGLKNSQLKAKELFIKSQLLRVSLSSCMNNVVPVITKKLPSDLARFTSTGKIS